MLALVAFLVFASPARSAGFSYGGIVESSKGEGLGGAQVLIEPADGGSPLVAYTNPSGVFHLAYVPSRFFVRANAVLYRPEGMLVDLSKEPPIGRLQLEADASPHPTETREVRSGPRDSGWGASWSPAYRLCTEAPSGTRIRSHSFRLQGDRSCGAWAECSPVEQTDARVCWEFRLQGHSELVLFGSGIRPSEGVLTVALEPVPRRAHGGVVVFIQCTNDTEGIATQLRSSLAAEGWRVAQLQTLSAPFPARIVVHGESKAAADSGTGEIVRAAQAFMRRALDGVGALPLVSTVDSEAIPSTVEIWLSRQTARQAR